MTDLTKILNNPEEHYPGNFDTPQRANALLTGLCQDAANEIAKLQAEVERLKANIALDKMAENARELGLDYEPTVQEPESFEQWNAKQHGDPEEIGFLQALRIAYCAGQDSVTKATPPTAQPAPVMTDEKGRPLSFWGGKSVEPIAQPAVQEGRDWSLLDATQESLREHMAEIKRLKAAQPVKTYHDGKPWPVQPAPDPAPIIQQLVTALEGSGTRMRSDQWYIEIEAVAAGKFYLNSKGEGL
jgi:uncharacterized small protein (DUF1192 family)